MQYLWAKLLRPVQKAIIPSQEDADVMVRKGGGGAEVQQGVMELICVQI